MSLYGEMKKYEIEAEKVRGRIAEKFPELASDHLDKLTRNVMFDFITIDELLAIPREEIVR